MRRQAFILTLGVLFVFVAPASRGVLANAPTAYTLTDLGTITDPGTNTGVVPTITGINAAGQISGSANLSVGMRAVRYDKGTGWHFVKGLEDTWSVATGINAHGDLSGYEMTSSIFAFRYVEGGGVTTLGLLPDGSPTLGLGINDNDDVVGIGFTPSGFVGWRAAGGGTTFTLLPMLPDSIQAMICGINNAGAIVGSSTLSSGATHAYRINADGTMDDAGSFDGADGLSASCAIDDNGRIGGYSSISGAQHAFRFDTGTLVDVDAFKSTESNVASVSAGVSVGYYTTTAGDHHAFVQNGTDTAVDLNTLLTDAPGWVLSDAFAVNSNGAIAGDGLLNGVSDDFLLTPVVTDTTPPVVSNVTASPSSIWPPRGQMVTVTIGVTATDDSGAAPACSLYSISGPGTAGTDYVVTGQFTGSVAAVGGRTYRFTATCVDQAGNAGFGYVDVPVPPDTTAPVIASVSATPSLIWPPNNKMVNVSVAVSASDDVDPSPVCALTTISGSSSDATITGPFSASVRATGGNSYTLTVTCRDFSGNQSTASTTVLVSKNSNGLMKANAQK